VPGDWVVPLPAGLSLYEAMALGTAGFTAALGIVRMEENGLRPEKGPVIVTGATGGWVVWRWICWPRAAITSLR
jgi:NADPH:quinone reductase-like Zn-dependent oxidoreductase